MTCVQAQAFVHAFVDGELAGIERDAFERHIGGCESCALSCALQARFKATVRAHLSRPSVPSGLALRIKESLDAEGPNRRWRWFGYPRLVPALAALALLVATTVTVRGRSRVFDQAERTYRTEMPMDVLGPDCASVASWFRGKVDFPVRAPSLRGATCKGGRLVNVRERPAAYLVYQMPSGHQVSFLVFDARDESLDTPRRRRIDDRDVYYSEGPGISAAAFHDRGLGYVATSDLDEAALTQFVTAAFER